MSDPSIPRIPSVRSPVGALARRSAIDAARANEPQSWGQALQRYTQHRTQPIHPAVLTPSVPSKFGMYNEAVKPVEFHPIRQEYTNPEREHVTRAREKLREKQHVETAQWREDHLANHKGYHVLTGVRQPTTNAEVSTALNYEETKHRTKVMTLPNGKRSFSYTPLPTHPPAREYDIINNSMAFEGSAERLAEAEKRPVPLHSRSAKEAREYNILNNRYQFEDHNARAAREQKANDARLREKYFASSHYNPVTLQFVHPQEEARYQIAKAQASASHGQQQLAQLPPRMKRAEGQCYDIIAPGIVKDPLQLTVTYERPAELQRAAHQMKYSKEREIQSRDLTLDTITAQRSTNRVSSKRYEQQLKRGHDIVSNKPIAFKQSTISTQPSRSSEGESKTGE